MTKEREKKIGKTAVVTASSRHSNLGFVRVGTAVPLIKVADPDYNATETISVMRKAQTAGVKVLVFPELGLTGYTCADLFQQKSLQQAALVGLERIVQASKSFSGILFVGTPLSIDNKLFNCAVAISGGTILGVVPKTFLPNYKEFYEKRWFAPSTALGETTHVRLFDQIVPVGVDLLFTATNVPGLVIGAEVCEDAWAPLTPGLLAALNNALIIVNLSASNELVGKKSFRKELVSSHASLSICAYLYTSAGVGESTTDVVFSGHSMICENGAFLAENARFEREAVLLTADVDLDKLSQERLTNPTFSDCQTQYAGVRSFRQVEFSVGTLERPDKLARFVDAFPFVPKDPNTLAERCFEIINIQTAGLTKRLEKLSSRSGKAPRVTIGVSGGLDSTLALIATVRTYDQLGFARSNIQGYTMPGFGTTSRTKKNAHALMKEMGITAFEVDIRQMCMAQMQAEKYKPFGIDLDGLTVETFTDKLVQAQETALAAGEELKDLHFENVQARMRTKILMDNGFVIGTGDVSELAKGWCTYNGDHMSMYNVNCSVPKTLVKFLVHWAALNVFDGETRVTLVDIVGTEISPELLPTGKDGKISQKTEEKVGPYELVDFFLYHMVRTGSSPEKIAYLAENAKFSKDYSRSEILRWLKDFLVRFFDNQFKRSCVPDGPKVGSISLSPRGDWRMPSDAEVTAWLTWVDKELFNVQQVEKMNANSTANIGKPNMTKAPLVYRVLVRVDIQNCFCPKGTLPVPDGDSVVPVANRLSRSGYYNAVVDSQDWHPADHGSFVSQHPGKKVIVETVTLNGVTQVVWPDHGVQNTADADFHKDLDRSMVAHTVRKGTDARVDSYSAFYDNGKGVDAAVLALHSFLGQSTGLADWIIAQATAAGADTIEVDVIGLATDFCVKFTALDAAGEIYKGTKFKVRVVSDACRGFDAAKAEAEMKAAGIEVITSDVVAPPVASK